MKERVGKHYYFGIALISLHRILRLFSHAGSVQTVVMWTVRDNTLICFGRHAFLKVSFFTMLDLGPSLKDILFGGREMY